MHRFSFIFCFSIVSLLFLGSCNEESTSTSVSGEVTSFTECKSFNKNTSETPGDESCVQYTYDDDEMILYLTHVNAGFNCCPGELTAEVSQNGDSIFISEYEEAPLCNCNCLFDLEIKLENIKEEIYHLKFIEPYAVDQESLIFSIDLTNSTSGSYCVSRTSYPWGIY